MLHERIVEHFVKKGILNQSYLYIKTREALSSSESLSYDKTSCMRL